MAARAPRLRDLVVASLLAAVIATAMPAHGSPAAPVPILPAKGLSAAPSKSSVEIRPEMELLAGALTQTDWLQTRGPVDDGNEYYRALAAFFVPYRDHRAIQLLTSLSGLGFNYEMPPAFICHLGPLPELDLRYEYSEDLVWAAGNRESLEELRLALRDLAAESNFDAFIARWQGSYAEWVGQAAGFAGDQAVAWLESFFGTKADQYHLILAPAMFPAGGYAASAVSATGGRSLFAIIREPGRSISAPEIPAGPQLTSLALHEWGHAFVNPALATRQSELGKVRTLYWRTTRAMKRQGYGSLEAFLDEQVLRAVTSIAADDLLDDPGALAEEANYHETLGFYLTRPVIELLREYQAERGQFPTFDSFVPRLLDGLSSYRVIIPPWAVTAAAALIVIVCWIKLRGALAERADRRRRQLGRQPWIWK